MNRKHKGELLRPSDPAPVAEYNSSGSAPVLIVCDHASRAIPQSLNSLGLPDECLKEHIAYDIGALDTARVLADLFDAPLMYNMYSRLVIDCNRYPGDVSSIPRTSDGVEIPGNIAADLSSKVARIEQIFQPYHNAILAKTEGLIDQGVVPLLIFVHSFAPVTKVPDSCQRRHDLGISWALDERVSRPLIQSLAGAVDICVGDNEPYQLDPGDDYSATEHALRRGLPHVQIEFRQDHVGTTEGAREWAERLHAELDGIMRSAPRYQLWPHWPATKFALRPIE